MKKILSSLVLAIFALTGAIIYNTGAPKAQAVYTSQDISAAIKNRIINGDFKISQRGTASTYTSFAAGTSGYTLADRWKMEAAGSMGSTATLSLSTTGLPTNRYGSALKVVATAAESAVATNELRQITQYIEGYNCADLFDGSTPITVSFWHKATKTGTYCVALNIVGATYFCNRTFTGSSSWTYQTVTFPPPPTGLTINTTTSAGLQLMFPLLAGTDFRTSSTVWQNVTTPSNKICNSSQVNSFDTINNEVWLYEVQLEKGGSPTPFEFRPYAQELRLAQRYCYAVNGADGYYISPGMGYKATATTLEQWVAFPVPMRGTVTGYNNISAYASTTPTGTQIAFNNGGGYLTLNSGSPGFYPSGQKNGIGYMDVTATTWSGTLQDPGYFLIGPSVIIIWDSEL